MSRPTHKHTRASVLLFVDQANYLPDVANMADVVLHHFLNIIVWIEWHRRIVLSVNQIERLHWCRSVGLLWSNDSDLLWSLNRRCHLNLLLIRRNVDIRLIIQRWMPARSTLSIIRCCPDMIFRVGHRASTITWTTRRIQKHIWRVNSIDR